MLSLITALLGLALAVANAVLLAALLGPSAERFGARNALWVVVACLAVALLAVPLGLGLRWARAQRARGRDARTALLAFGMMFGWNAAVLALILSVSPRPVGLIVAENGNWLPDRVLGPDSKATRLLARFTPPVQEIEDLKPTMRRFLGATTTPALEPELTSESAAALGARGLRMLPAKDAKLFARYTLDDALVKDDAALAGKVVPVGHPFLRDVHELMVAAKPDNVAWGLTLIRSYVQQRFHVDFERLAEHLQYKRASPTVVLITAPDLGPGAKLEAHLEDGHWRVDLGPFAELMKSF